VSRQARPPPQRKRGERNARSAEHVVEKGPDQPHAQLAPPWRRAAIADRTEIVALDQRVSGNERSRACD
jgi:hypothetical protein